MTTKLHDKLNKALTEFPELKISKKELKKFTQEQQDIESAQNRINWFCRMRGMLV